MTHFGEIRSALNELASEKSVQTFVLQKVHDGLSFANASRLLLTSPVPSDLDKDTSLDYINVSAFGHTSETLVIDETWVSPTYDIRVRNEGEAVVRLGLMNYSSNSSSVIDAVIFQLGTINTNGTFTAEQNITADYDYSTNQAGSYAYVTKQAYFEDLSFDCSASEHLALRTKVYAHANNSDILTNVRLECNRGAYDSYLTLKIDRK